VRWFTAGGGLKPGESHEQAALRELREENRADEGPAGPGSVAQLLAFLPTDGPPARPVTVAG
jgi:8-oxo-dGTP pyrophosphatase MutT (NUDIX family)